jgi:glycosyl transferase family 25
LKKVFKISILLISIGLGSAFVRFPGFFLLPCDKDGPSLQKELLGSVSVTEGEVRSDQTAVYVINLDRNPERFEQIRSLVLMPLGLPFFRIQGVYGKDIPEEKRNQLTSYKVYELAFNGNRPGPGEFGCFVSHTKAWRAFLSSPYQTALILEDDARLCFEPETVLQMLNRLKTVSDLCLLDGQDGDHREISSILSLESWQQGNIKVSAQLSCHENINAGAYVINRRAAKALLSKAHHFCLPADHYVQRAWEFPISVTYLSPRLFHQKAGPSMIESGRRKLEKNHFSAFQRIFQKLQTQVCHAKRGMARSIFHVGIFLQKKWQNVFEKN